MKRPVRIGIVGMGGFAGAHHSTVARLEERGEVRLVCTCDPSPAHFGIQQKQWRFADRGVRVFGDYRQMLESCHRELDAVVLPTPLQLHAEMHAAAAAFGLPSYLEKPATLDHAELERMIALDAQLPKASLVGFNFIVEKTRLALKQRLLAGEFGPIRGATLTARWARPTSYFKPGRPAGRLVHAGCYVVDSCLGNSLAHFVHNLLFWGGRTELFSWAQLVAVRAELYRAHATPGADTFFVEADTASGVTMRFALTHACAGACSQAEVIVCERATLRYVVGQRAEVRWNDGRTESIALEPFDGLEANHLDYYRYLCDEQPRPATMLADSRPFVLLNNLAYISSGHIAAIPDHLVIPLRDEREQQDYLDITGMAAAQESFTLHGTWPGGAGWNRPPASIATPADVGRFHDVIQAMMRQ